MMTLLVWPKSGSQEKEGEKNEGSSMSKIAPQTCIYAKMIFFSKAVQNKEKKTLLNR